ncbi:MAG: hypothetical protein ACREBU_02360 [Nitrososphaera sp.]
MAMESVLGGLQWRQLLTLINQRPGIEQPRPGRKPSPGQIGSGSGQGNFGPYVVPGTGPVMSAPKMFAPPGQPTIPPTDAMPKTPGLPGGPNMITNTLKELDLFEGLTGFFQFLVPGSPPGSTPGLPPGSSPGPYAFAPPGQPTIPPTDAMPKTPGLPGNFGPPGAMPGLPGPGNGRPIQHRTAGGGIISILRYAGII